MLKNKPWGCEKIIAQSDTYVVKQIFVRPNHRLSLQFHQLKTETMFLVEGDGILELGAKTIKMELLTPYHIKPTVIHRLGAGEAGCLVVEISSTELDDVFRLEDDHGRV